MKKIKNNQDDLVRFGVTDKLDEFYAHRKYIEKKLKRLHSKKNLTKKERQFVLVESVRKEMLDLEKKSKANAPYRNFKEWKKIWEHDNGRKMSKDSEITYYIGFEAGRLARNSDYD